MHILIVAVLSGTRLFDAISAIIIGDLSNIRLFKFLVSFYDKEFPLR